jgi:hypothetical protein
MHVGRKIMLATEVLHGVDRFRLAIGGEIDDDVEVAVELDPVLASAAAASLPAPKTSVAPG